MPEWITAEWTAAIASAISALVISLTSSFPELCPKAANLRE